MAPGKGRDKLHPWKSSTARGGGGGGGSSSSSSASATGGGVYPRAPSRADANGAAYSEPSTFGGHAVAYHGDRSYLGAADRAVAEGIARAGESREKPRRTPAAAAASGSDAGRSGRLGRLARLLRIRHRADGGAPPPAETVDGEPSGRGGGLAVTANAEQRLLQPALPLGLPSAPAASRFAAPGAGVRERVCYVEVKSLAHESDDESDGERRRRWQAAAAAQSRWCTTVEADDRSRSADRGRGADGSRRPRSSSRSRDIIALYTSYHYAGPAAAAAPAPRSRASSVERSTAASAAPAPSTASASASGSQRKTPTKGDGGLYGDRLSYATAASVSVRSSSFRSATPDARRRSRSATRTPEDIDVISINGTRVLAPGYFSEPRRALSSSDIAAENLRVWMAAALVRQRSASQQLPAAAAEATAGSDGDRRCSESRYSRGGRAVAVLETDKGAEARVEALLAASDSTNRASAPMLVVAGHTTDPTSWISQDEVDVAAGAIVTGLYKQNEWLRVRTEDGREGFIPYAFTRPLRPAPSSPREGGAGRNRDGHRVGGGGDAAAVAGDRCRPLDAVAPTVADAAARERRTASDEPDVRLGQLRIGAHRHGRGAEARDRAIAESDAASATGSDATRRGDASACLGRHAGGACKFYQRSRLAFGSSAQQRRNSDDASSVLSSDDSVFRSPTPHGALASLKMARYAESPSVRSPSLAGGCGGRDDGGDVVHSDSGISEPGSFRSDSHLGRRSARDTFSSVSLATAAPPAGVMYRDREEQRPRAAAGDPRGGKHGAATERLLDPPLHFAAAAATGAARARHAGGAACAAAAAQPFFVDDVADGRSGAGAREPSALAPPPPVGSVARWAAPVAAPRPDIPRNAAGPLVTVTYDYRAANDDDVSVWVGETVRVLNADDIEWVWVRKCDGCEGFVPRQYVQIEHANWACQKPYVTAV